MVNDMPSCDDYTGLARKVLQYSEHFPQIVNKIKQPGFGEADEFGRQILPGEAGADGFYYAALTKT